jgi:hypothetical protein
MGPGMQGPVNFFELSKLLYQESAWAHPFPERPGLRGGAGKCSNCIAVLRYPEHFSQYYELSSDCYEQLSLAESCVNFCGFGLHPAKNALAAL